jgi:hypothetical protein
VGSLFCHFATFGEVVTVHHLIRVTGLVITLTLLLALVVGPAQAHQASSAHSKAAPVSTDDAEQTEDTALVCLALVGGAALLAGAAWVGKIRRMLS